TSPCNQPSPSPYAVLGHNPSRNVLDAFVQRPDTPGETSFTGDSGNGGKGVRAGFAAVVVCRQRHRAFDVVIEDGGNNARAILRRHFQRAIHNLAAQPVAQDVVAQVDHRKVVAHDEGDVG